MGRGQPASSASGNDLYKLRTFEMQVRLRFERIPVFLRRLISNSWRYRVRIMDIMPVETLTSSISTPLLTGAPPGGGMTPARSMARRGGGGERDDLAPRQTQLAAGGGAPRRSGQAAPPPIEVGNYVILRLIGEAYQFSPLMTKYRDKLEKRATPAAPAPADRPATPTGAR